MSESMVERVAIAMRERYADFSCERPLVPFKKSKAKEAWLECARAAIEALREPTEAMTDAVKRMEVFAVCGEHEATVLPDLGARPGLQSLWRAMISAALT